MTMPAADPAAPAAPPCAHAFIDDPWSLALRVCLYCGERDEAPELPVRIAPPTAPGAPVIDWRRRHLELGLGPRRVR